VNEPEVDARRHETVRRYGRQAGVLPKKAPLPVAPHATAIARSLRPGRGRDVIRERLANVGWNRRLFQERERGLLARVHLAAAEPKVAFSH
jgi:hypothetical protein